MQMDQMREEFKYASEQNDNLIKENNDLGSALV